jgi:hypothetical protein
MTLHIWFAKAEVAVIDCLWHAIAGVITTDNQRAVAGLSDNFGGICDNRHETFTLCGINSENYGSDKTPVAAIRYLRQIHALGMTANKSADKIEKRDR